MLNNTVQWILFKRTHSSSFLKNNYQNILEQYYLQKTVIIPSPHIINLFNSFFLQRVIKNYIVKIIKAHFSH